MVLDFADPGPASPRKTERLPARVYRPGNRGITTVAFGKSPVDKKGRSCDDAGRLVFSPPFPSMAGFPPNI